MNTIQELRQRALAVDEKNGFIQREQAIDLFLQGEVPQAQDECYVSALEFVLERLSTPIAPGDVLLGRMEEGKIDFPMEIQPASGVTHANNPFAVSHRNTGHVSLDYDALLRVGLTGIVRQMEQNARTSEQKRFCAQSARAVSAIGRFARRYAQAACKAGLIEAAAALERVPLQPAATMQEALQSVWLMHWLLSCVVGGRDFAFSRLTLSLLPFFRQEEEARTERLLAHFLLLCNSIGGFGTELGTFMPVPCAATNMYLMLGGQGAEMALSLDLLALKAAEQVGLPQPVLALRLCKDSPREWKLACAHAAQTLGGQVSLYNDDSLIPALTHLGFAPGDARNYTMSGCNRVEYQGHQSADTFHNCPKWLLEAFYNEKNATTQDILADFGRIARREIAQSQPSARVPAAQEARFHLESLLLHGCAQKAIDIENGGQDSESFVHNLAGIATIADSLAAIEQLVFVEKKLTLTRLREIVRENFAQEGVLRDYLVNRCPKYGNDDERADKWAKAAGALLVDAVRARSGENGWIHIPSLYALYFQHAYGKQLGATPDGRRAGESISENQSPTYGCDTQGLTALLRSASALPQRQCGAGGLNLRLSRRVDDALLASLTDTYFALGGVNLAPNVMTRETLLAAKAEPEKYKNLCVRIVGYAEVFVRLPEYVQQGLIDRTEEAL